MRAVSRVFDLASGKRLALTRLALGASALAFASCAQAASLNDGFSNGLNGENSRLNTGAATQAQTYEQPTRDYDRSRNPAQWNRHGVAQPRVVQYTGRQPAGAIVVDHKNQHLYLIMQGGRAREYTVVVGRKGLEISGTRHVVSRMEVDPTWTDGRDQTFTTPGPTNPLGVRGIFLAGARDRVELGFVIHGTNDPKLLALADGKRKFSHGCIRMHNEDVMDLYARIRPGAQVVVDYNGAIANEIRAGRQVTLQP